MNILLTGANGYIGQALTELVLCGVLPNVSTPTIFRGVMPFLVSDFIRIAILIAFPAISLYSSSFVR